jgi:hypothetical protein
MEAVPAVIPGLTRDPEAAAGWIPAFAGMTKAPKQGQLERDGSRSRRHPGLDPGSRSGRRLDSGVRRNDESGNPVTLSVNAAGFPLSRE